MRENFRETCCNFALLLKSATDQTVPTSIIDVMNMITADANLHFNSDVMALLQADPWRLD